MRQDQALLEGRADSSVALPAAGKAELGPLGFLCLHHSMMLDQKGKGHDDRTTVKEDRIAYRDCLDHMQSAGPSRSTECR